MAAALASAAAMELLPQPCLGQANPLEVLGPDIMRAHVLPLLRANDLLRAARVCRAWRSAASEDALWAPECEVRRRTLLACHAQAASVACTRVR